MDYEKTPKIRDKIKVDRIPNYAEGAGKELIVESSTMKKS